MDPSGINLTITLSYAGSPSTKYNLFVFFSHTILILHFFPIDHFYAIKSHQNFRWFCQISLDTKGTSARVLFLLISQNFSEDTTNG